MQPGADGTAVPSGTDVLRRIKRIPKMFSCDRTTMPIQVGPHPASFSDSGASELSVHSVPVMEARGRDLQTVYDDDVYASVRFPVNVVVQEGMSILWSTPPPHEESDDDRRAAHADMQIHQLAKPEWRDLRNLIIAHSEWVQSWREEDVVNA